MIDWKNNLAAVLGASNDLPYVLQQFKTALDEDPTQALSLRPQLYECLKENKFKNIDDSFMALIPPSQRLLYDKKFMVEFLISTDIASLGSFLRQQAQLNPVHCQILVDFAVRQLIKLNNTQAAIEVFAQALTDLGVDPASLDKFDPSKQYLPTLESIGNANGFTSAMESFYAKNQVLASRLCSSFLQHFLLLKDIQVALDVFEIKSRFNTLVSKDLHWIMFIYVYLNRPQQALDLYDQQVDLHQDFQNDALILASAKANDWNRLQATFERIEFGKRSASNYEITLRALGELGGPELLNAIYDNISRDGKMPLQVYHALIYSYGTIGYLDMVKDIFQELCRTSQPTRLSFTLLFKALHNTSELEYALRMLGKMVGEYHIPLSNSELSQILSLCATKKDLESAASLFKWASGLFEPDQISWNAYLSALSENSEMAFREWKKMPHKSDIITLTTVLTPYATFGNRERSEEIMASKRRLKLKSDEPWLGTVLMYYCQINAVTEAEKVFKELKRGNSKLPGGYYATLLNLYARLRKISEAQRLFKTMKDSKTFAGVDFYTKYVRMLMKYDSQQGVELAYKVVMNMFEERLFDLNSKHVPRTVVPPSVIKPVVRALIKRGLLDRASKLLTMTDNQEPAVPEPWMVSALKMELFNALNNQNMIEHYWNLFTTELKQAFVIFVDKKDGRSAEYKLPRSQRHVFYRQINIEIGRLVSVRKYKDALALPQKISKLGLEMNSQNWNFLVKQLATCDSDPMLIKAFDIAENVMAMDWLRAHNDPTYRPTHHPVPLDQRTIRILHSSFTNLSAIIARKNSQGLPKTWRSMLKLYPRMTSVFNTMKTKMKPN